MGLSIGVTPGAIEDLSPVPESNETTTTYHVEIIRTRGEVIETFNDVAATEVVRPGGTVTNIGAGPVLPTRPYEGQVWILT